MPTEIKRGLDFAGRGASEISLAATRRPVHQNSAADRLAVGLVQVGVRQRMDDLQADFLLHLFHAAHVVEIDFRPFNFTLGRGFLFLAPPGANLAFHHFTFLLRRTNAKTRRKFSVCEGVIQLHRAFVFGDGLRDFANARKNFCVQQKGARRHFRGFDQILKNDKRMVLFPLLKKGAGEPEFHWQAVRRLGEAFAKFLFGFLAISVVEQRVSEQQTERRVIR